MTVDMNTGLGEYRDVQARGSLSDADPHRVVQVMLQTAIDRLSEARGHMDREDAGGKTQAIGKALAIVEALQLNLDPERGGEVARNLNDLYDYMTRTLLQANAEGDATRIGEVSKLLAEIKAGWDGIEAQD